MAERLPLFATAARGTEDLLASRASRALPSSEEEEGEAERRWWEWQCPEGAPALNEPTQEPSTDFEFVDEPASDLPPELKVAALPRWMRSVPEQGHRMRWSAKPGAGRDGNETPAGTGMDRSEEFVGSPASCAGRQILLLKYLRLPYAKPEIERICTLMEITVSRRHETRANEMAHESAWQS